MNWKIYYADGSVFSSDDGTPEESPHWGVVCVAYRDKAVGRGVMQGFDFYCYVRGEWRGHDLIGLMDSLALREAPVVNRGMAVGDRQYQEIIQKAIDDPDFPPKSGRRRREAPRRV